MKRSKEHAISSKTAILIAEASNLCFDCLKRQGVPTSISRTFRTRSDECDICKGLITQLPQIAASSLGKLKDYQFESFLVGTSLPQQILDKEDEIRSKFKIRGREGIKAQISKAITSEIAKRTKKQIEYSHPDLTLLVYLPDSNVVVTPRSLWMLARYRKTMRGLAQRSSTCRICNGVGCATCNYKGASETSVQSIVGEFFSKTFDAEGCSFIWMGSEDEKSLVKGDGRPFFVEVQKPKKRNSVSKFSKPIDLHGVVLSSIEVLASRPTYVPQFSMSCVVYLSNKDPAQEPKISKSEIESKFRDAIVDVKISRKYKTVRRRIHSIKVGKGGKNHPWLLRIECDGGIPIKKLVSGMDETVSPNLSLFLQGLALDPEMPFDIMNIKLSGPMRGVARSRSFIESGSEFEMATNSGGGTREESGERHEIDSQS